MNRLGLVLVFIGSAIVAGLMVEGIYAKAGIRAALLLSAVIALVIGGVLRTMEDEIAAGPDPTMGDELNDQHL